MNEKKTEQLGLRVPSETKEAFAELCAAHGCGQGEGLQILMDLYKLQKAAEANPKRAEILSAFRSHVAALVSLQEASLVLAEDAKACARDEFVNQLEQNAQLIRTQQADLAAKETTLSELRAQLSSALEEYSRANQKATESSERYEYAQRKIEEMNQKIASMAEEAAETKAMSKNYQRLLEEVNELRRENKILSDQMKDAEIAHAGEIRKLEEAKHQAQLEAERLKRGGNT